MSVDWTADLDAWPIARIRLAGAPREGELPRFESLAESFDAVLDRGERCGVVIDLTGAAPDAQRRRRASQLLEARRESIERWVSAAAIVMPSPFHRGIVTALRWLVSSPPAVRWDTFATEAEGLAWVRARLAERP